MPCLSGFELYSRWVPLNLTATLRSFLISSPQLTPKKGVTAVLKNATRVHDVVV